MYDLQIRKLQNVIWDQVIPNTPSIPTIRRYSPRSHYTSERDKPVNDMDLTVAADRGKMWVRRLYCSRQNTVLLMGLDEGYFRNFTRISSQDFALLVNIVGHTIGKKNIKFRN
ncbi:hypothetical protein PR048_011056 [Dryococelus australis]|uniref:Uncharacterized protein n=1 Tax=Dryococelus australis TaxID=614101 RepID=A0ABQ9HL11_9NEOP|nr:hypothetical protein PR048_011056 [Dryococelus australis]